MLTCILILANFLHECAIAMHCAPISLNFMQTVDSSTTLQEFKIYKSVVLYRRGMFTSVVVHVVAVPLGLKVAPSLSAVVCPAFMGDPVMTPQIRCTCTLKLAFLAFILHS